MSKNWRASEEDVTARNFLRKKGDAIKVGDTIEFEPNNQTGCVKYKVILNVDGEKDLEEISSYCMSDEDDDETKSGGKRRRRRKTKRTRKSRRKRKTRRGKKR